MRHTKFVEELGSCSRCWPRLRSCRGNRGTSSSLPLDAGSRIVARQCPVRGRRGARSWHSRSRPRPPRCRRPDRWGCRQSRSCVPTSSRVDARHGSVVAVQNPHRALADGHAARRIARPGCRRRPNSSWDRSARPSSAARRPGLRKIRESRRGQPRRPQRRRAAAGHEQLAEPPRRGSPSPRAPASTGPGRGGRSRAGS